MPPDHCDYNGCLIGPKECGPPKINGPSASALREGLSARAVAAKIDLPPIARSWPPTGGRRPGESCAAPPMPAASSASPVNRPPN